MGTGSYFDKALCETNANLIGEMRMMLHGTKYDTIVGTGLSGTIFAARVAPGLSKKFAIVRKPHHGSHSGIKVEGQVGKRWVFVDDFVSSGATLKRTLEMMQSKHPDAVFVGVYQYEYSRWEDKTEAALNYGLWSNEVTLGPAFGPLTREALLRKEPFADVPLKCPANGWSYNVLNLIKPTEDRRRLEVDYPDGYGRPTIYDLDNCARLTCENKNALPLIEEVENAAASLGLSIRRLVGERMNRLPKAAPRVTVPPKVDVKALQDYQEKLYQEEQAVFRAMSA